VQLYGNAIVKLEQCALDIEKEIFNQTILNQSIALIFQGTSKNANSTLREAYEEYVNNWEEIHELRTQWKEDLLMNIKAREQMRQEIEISIQNLLSISNPKVQIRMLQKIYELPKSDATLLADFLGTSAADRLEKTKDRIIKSRFKVLKSKETEFDSIARRDNNDERLIGLQVEIDRLDDKITIVNDDEVIDLKMKVEYLEKFDVLN
jgi:hypothetical protein